MKNLPIIFCTLCLAGCVGSPATEETRDIYVEMRALNREIVELQDAQFAAQEAGNDSMAQEVASKIQSRERAFESLQRRVDALAPAREQEREQASKTRGMIMGALAMVGPYLMRLIGAAARVAA